MTAPAAATVAHRRPLWLGAVVAPCAVPVTLALLAGFDAMRSGHGASVATAIEVFAFAAALGLPLAYAGVVTLGLPLVLWLRARGLLSVWRLLLVSPALGSATLVAGFRIAGFGLGLGAQIGLGAALGLVVTALFCAVSGIPLHARRCAR